MERLPPDIEIGTKVFDSEGRHIGQVDDLKYPANAVAADVEVATGDAQASTDTIVDAVADAFGRDDIPEPLRSQLLRDGYIHLDAHGFFARDRYVLPEQIARRDAEGIFLNVTIDALIKKT